MDKPADHKPSGMARLTVSEIESLADRLTSRGVSKLLDDMPSTQADMRAAARVIRGLLNRVDAAAALCGNAQSLLRNLTLEI